MGVKTSATAHEVEMVGEYLSILKYIASEGLYCISYPLRFLTIVVVSKICLIKPSSRFFLETSTHCLSIIKL